MCAADGSSAMGQYREESASNHRRGGPGLVPRTHCAQNSATAKSTGRKPHGTRRSTIFPQLWRPVWKGRKYLLTRHFFPLKPHVFKR